MTAARTMVLDERFDASVSRPVAKWMARPLYRWGFSADQVSLMALGFGVTAGLCLASPGLWPMIGGLLLIAMVVTDCADGEVARLGPPSDKPWRGRMFDGFADLGTVLSVHIGMIIALSHSGFQIGSHTVSVFEYIAIAVVGFASFSWKSSVLDDVKQRLKPRSVDNELARYADQEKTWFERILYAALVRYVQTAARLSGHGRPGGYPVFRQVAHVGPSHHLVAIAIAGMLMPVSPAIYLAYFALTIIPGNLYLWTVLHRARRAEVTA